TKWAAHGQNPVPYLHAIGVAHFRGGQCTVKVNLDHRKIGFLIGSDNLGIVLHAWRIVLETDSDAIRLFDYVPIGHDVTLGVDDYAGTQGPLANRAVAGTTLALAARPRLTAGTTEEMVKKVVHPAAAVAVIVVGILSPAPVHVLNGRFRVDIDYARFQLFRNLRKSVRHLLRRGEGERCGIALLPFFSFHAVRDNGPDQNADGKSRQNTQGIGPAMSLHAHPHRARIHKPTCLRKLFKPL